jgi:chorismate mutase / prephenate dehydratase
MTDKLKELDAKILQLANERCQLLAETQNLPQAESPRTLLATQSRVGEGLHLNDFELALLRYVSGASFLASVQRQSIAYLGPQFSYSYSAAAKVFGPIDALQSVNSIGAVFDEILRGQANYGVVPIENSTDGRIVDTLNMFIKTPVKICGEVLLPIHHNLLATCKREDSRQHGGCGQDCRNNTLRSSCRVPRRRNRARFGHYR